MDIVWRISSIGVSTPVTLAIIALIGYVVGQRRRASAKSAHDPSSELRKTTKIVRDLESVSQNVRRSLANHHASIAEFQRRIADLCNQRDESTWDELSHEAQRIMQPTLALSQEIAHAYDEIRRQTDQCHRSTHRSPRSARALSERKRVEQSLDELISRTVEMGTALSAAIVHVGDTEGQAVSRGALSRTKRIQDVAHVLNEQVQSGELLARWEANEFVLAMPGSELEGATRRCEQIRRVVLESFSTQIHVGVASARQADTARLLLARADSALYTAKSSRTDRVYQHDGHRIEKARLAKVAFLPPDRSTAAHVSSR